MLDYQLAPDYRFLNFKDIKIGSKLLVKSLKWYKENEEETSVHIGSTFVNGMAKFCGKIVTVENIFKDTFDPGDCDIYDAGCEDAAIYIKEDGGDCVWSLGMFQGIKVSKSLNLE